MKTIYILVLLSLLPYKLHAKNYDFATYKEFKAWYKDLNHNQRGETELRLLNNYKRGDFFFLRPNVMALKSKKDYYRCKRLIEKRDNIITRDWAREAKCRINGKNRFGIMVSIKEFDNTILKVFYEFSGPYYVVDNGAFVNGVDAPDNLYKMYFERAKKSAGYNIAIKPN